MYAIIITQFKQLEQVNLTFMEIFIYLLDKKVKLLLELNCNYRYHYYILTNYKNNKCLSFQYLPCCFCIFMNPLLVTEQGSG